MQPSKSEKKMTENPDLKKQKEEETEEKRLVSVKNAATSVYHLFLALRFESTKIEG